MSQIPLFTIFQVGIKNLRYASTNLNRSSSRSHSIFQIRVVRQSTKDGSVGKIHQIAFCDLAGAERTAKAQSKGERLQEACMINLSLATLHHVMDALRYNAKAKIKKPLRIRCVFKAFPIFYKAFLSFYFPSFLL